MLLRIILCFFLLNSLNKENIYVSYIWNIHSLSNDHHGIDTDTNDSPLRILNFVFNYTT